LQQFPGILSAFISDPSAVAVCRRSHWMTRQPFRVNIFRAH